MATVVSDLRRSSVVGIVDRQMITDNDEMMMAAAAAPFRLSKIENLKSHLHAWHVITYEIQ